MVGSGVFEGKGVMVDVVSGSMTALVIVLWTSIPAFEEAVSVGEIVDKGDIGLGVLDLLTVDAGIGAVLLS